MWNDLCRATVGDNVPIFVFGNKLDLDAKRVVSSKVHLLLKPPLSLPCAYHLIPTCPSSCLQEIDFVDCQRVLFQTLLSLLGSFWAYWSKLRNCYVRCR